MCMFSLAFLIFARSNQPNSISPRLKHYLRGRILHRPYKSCSFNVRARAPQPEPPAGPTFLAQPRQTEHNSPKFWIFEIFRPCKNWAWTSKFSKILCHHPTFTYQNFMSKIFSGTPRPSRSINTYQSPNWRTDIANDLWNPELWTKTGWFPWIFSFAFFVASTSRRLKLKAGVKPSTWLPPGGLVERLLIPANNKKQRKWNTEINTLQQKTCLPNTIANHMADTNVPTNHAPEHVKHVNAQQPCQKQTSHARRARTHGKTHDQSASNAPWRKRTQRLGTTRKPKHPTNRQTINNKQWTQFRTSTEHRRLRSIIQSAIRFKCVRHHNLQEATDIQWARTDIDKHVSLHEHGHNERSPRMRSLSWRCINTINLPLYKKTNRIAGVTFHQIWWSTPSPASRFSKISSFRNFGVMHRVGWSRITFSICNGQPSYFQKMKPKHFATTWLENFFRICSFRQWNFGLKNKTAQTIQAHSCEQLPLLMQFLYGVTSLRDICTKKSKIKFKTTVRGAFAVRNSNSMLRNPDNDRQTAKQMTIFKDL